MNAVHAVPVGLGATEDGEMIGVLGEGDARLNRALLLLEKRANEKSSCHGALVRGVLGKSAARIRTDDHGGPLVGRIRSNHTSRLCP